MEIREIDEGDLPQLLALYTHLHDNTMPDVDDNIKKLWNKIISDPDHHIIVGVENNEIISACVLLIIPNLTRGQRPYALIENVVTHAYHRKKGYATRILAFAREIARQNNCYKIMLMTGSKDSATLRFYENAGYNQHDKKAFIQWL